MSGHNFIFNPITNRWENDREPGPGTIRRRNQDINHNLKKLGIKQEVEIYNEELKRDRAKDELRLKDQKIRENKGLPAGDYYERNTSPREIPYDEKVSPSTPFEEKKNKERRQKDELKRSIRILGMEDSQHPATDMAEAEIGQLSSQQFAGLPPVLRNRKPFIG